MKLKQLILILICIGSFQVFSQGYLPLSNYYHNEADRLLLNDSTGLTSFNQHQSLKPILDTRTITQKLYRSEGKYYYWITQKLFKENFIIFKGDGFWCSIDPIVDLEMGTDFSADSLKLNYWNTRGIRIQGKFLSKIAFSTSIYENQAVLPDYQTSYVNQFGEFIPNGSNTTYYQNNAVIPGYARTKPFKTTGYDFAYASGNVSFTANEYLNFQLGNGNHFIGNGYRSLLLSDFTVNYPFAKIETNFWSNKIQYNTIYALHQNLYRLHTFSTPEATYERKIGTYHYLDIAVNSHIELGLFEGNHWQRVDSLGTHQPDYLWLNPLPFMNTILKGDEANGFNSVLGLNFSVHYNTFRGYAQAVFDQGTISAYQVGLKFMDVVTKKLDLLIEYNHADANTYQSSNNRYNYSHYNLPLAHPYTNGFDEIIFALDYQFKRLFFHNQVNYSRREQSDIAKARPVILLPSTSASNTSQTHIIYNQFEMGYRFNKAYNLQFVVGHLYRNETSPAEIPLTNYTYVGLKTGLKNKYLDY